MEHTLAIDFGTTNSTVYLLRNAYKGNEVVTGYAAKRLFGMDRQFVVGSVKKLIGLTYESYLKLDRQDIFVVMMVILTLL